MEEREGSVVCLSKGLVRCWVRTGCSQNSQGRDYSLVSPRAVPWRALLGACGVWQNSQTLTRELFVCVRHCLPHMNYSPHELRICTA